MVTEPAIDSAPIFSITRKGAGFRSLLRSLLQGVSWSLILSPAMLAALLLSRCVEIIAVLRSGGISSGVVPLVLTAFGFDLICFIKYLPVLLLIACGSRLIFRSDRARLRGVGILWSVVLVAHAALVQFFLTARFPLGADLFGYSWQDIRQTVAAGAEVNVAAFLGFLLPLAGLWFLLALLGRFSSAAGRGARTTLLLLIVSIAFAVAAPSRPSSARFAAQYDGDVVLNKGAYFIEENLAYLLKRSRVGDGNVTAGAAGFRYLDPQYPFLRAEQTPDLLGADFTIHPDRPPNLVFIIVEGLGRSFTGPDATHGSFTPFLDELASRSLSWDNFLATQGRTFGVLPSIFGSLPFGEKGFNALGDRMPPHVTLLSLLKGQGYRLKFYGGFDLDFDNERDFFTRQGMDLMVSKDDFGPSYAVSPGGADHSWGYADNELVTRMLDAESHDTKQPFVAVIQTVTMHTPYTFPGQDRYAKIFEAHLDRLGIPPERKGLYREFQNIYTSILYLDDSLKRFFEEFAKDPAFENTIFIITGDHSLPEIPLTTRIARYHVPLIITSPLLTSPARIKSISSQFDLAPSLLAFLAHNFGLRTPAAVTWLGSGLDMEPSFRNIHEYPLKHTVTNLVDYLSDTWFINQGALYAVSDRMNLEPVNDDSSLAMVTARFDRFKAANDRFERHPALLPNEAMTNLVAYRDEDRSMPGAPVVQDAVLEVSDVVSPPATRARNFRIEITLRNSGVKSTDKFIPLVVLLTADGREVSESYGQTMLLLPGSDTTVSFPVKIEGAAPGQYYMAVFPSHPDTGKKVGAGRYHISIVIRG